jgi:hypothetical protein
MSLAYLLADAALGVLVVYLLVRALRRPPPDEQYGDRDGW